MDELDFSGPGVGREDAENGGVVGVLMGVSWSDTPGSSLAATVASMDGLRWGMED